MHYKILFLTKKKPSMQEIKKTMEPYRWDGEDEDVNYKRLGLDWKKLAADGTADALAVMSVTLPKNAKGEAVWEVTRAAYAHAYANRGRAKVFYHCSMYDGGQVGIPIYSRLSGLSRGECARRLLQLAEEFHGAGVVLECVDYSNYPEEVVKELDKTDISFSTVTGFRRSESKPCSR